MPSMKKQSICNIRVYAHRTASAWALREINITLVEPPYEYQNAATNSITQLVFFSSLTLSHVRQLTEPTVPRYLLACTYPVWSFIVILLNCKGLTLDQFNTAC